EGGEIDVAELPSEVVHAGDHHSHRLDQGGEIRGAAENSPFEQEEMRADVADAQVSDDPSRGPPERGLVSDQREPPGIEVEHAQSDRQQNDPRRSRNTLPLKKEQE